MPLNKIFGYFHQKQQQNTKQTNNYQNNILKNEYLINNSIKGLGGCCSRKTSSSIPSNELIQNKKQSWNGRKNSDQLKHQNYSSEQLFSDILLCKIFDTIDNPFELIRLKRVSKKVEEYVKNRISSVIELDICRVKFENLSSSSTSSSSLNSSSSSIDNNIIIIEGEIFYLHPILVDEQWTSKEINILYYLINEFRINLKRISLDAPIFELIVAKLASIDLDRWFAYQCFVKAIDECQMNVTLNKLAKQLQQEEHYYDNKINNNLYWPNAKNILIRTTENESIHLARVLNYGVRSNLVMDKRQLNCLSLQIYVKDENKAILRICQRPKQLIKNLYHFRCWAGSAGFDERFSQQWKAINNTT
ncbi:hypothetical protein Mgra_00010230 [Meloidogyne graminicola]|uniref:Uncharacterized protein n=1 Tax=Meloidogyne graminicola TaxID=189291 RepID=A0A8S9Z5S1_9BILA|nr:hypothetical protein Mgra_00010230 [Meloidogyne graminicola]